MVKVNHRARPVAHAPVARRARPGRPIERDRVETVEKRAAENASCAGRGHRDHRGGEAGDGGYVFLRRLAPELRGAQEHLLPAADRARRAGPRGCGPDDLHVQAVRHLG